MNGDIAVSVRDLTKKYRLFSTPIERLKESLHPLRKRYHKEFWALNGICFDVPKGQVVGILGRNGSGKSTLLQIIASVLQPTSGTITVNGRVSALLELGAGFNPEFTGRQNVLLNGAIMGVSHDEILERMSAIMAFADIGEFFDQPMKIYSSGMFVRVAFAASVHVDPDILIIDETLAVGDAKFQHKCFQRLADLQAQHKTVILVSHNSSLVTSYCDQAFLLDKGQLIASGDPAHVVDRYYDLLFDNRAVSTDNLDGVQFIASGARNELAEIIDQTITDDLCHTRRSYNKNEVRFGTGAARIVDYAIESEGHGDVTNIQFGTQIQLYIKVLFCRNVEMPIVGFTVKTLEGIEIFGTNTFLMGKKLKPVSQGQICVFRFSFSLRVNPSDYFFNLGVAEVDGTRGGTVLDVRRSIAHCVVSLDTERSFDGLLDLAPSFEVLADDSRRSVSDERYSHSEKP
jgi:ABC-type polysaccharide/polyol phosphate transport system ATPase subunit